MLKSVNYIWLVVDLPPLKNISSSAGMMKFPIIIWKTCSKPPARYKSNMIIPNFPLRSTCHTDEAVEEPLEDVHSGPRGLRMRSVVGRVKESAMGITFRWQLKAKTHREKALVERQLKCWCFIFFTIFLMTLRDNMGQPFLFDAFWSCGGCLKNWDV